VTGHVPEEILNLSLRNSDTRGSAELRQAIASVYESLNMDSILVTTGTSEALFIYFHVRFEPGANVVVPFPAFQTLYEVPRHLGYEVRLLPLRLKSGFRPDLDELASMVDSKTKVIVINNPHNPTGIEFSNDELEAINKIAQKHGAEILADEHYRFLPHDDRSLITSLYGRAPNIVAVGSMIKCFGCVGLRVGWLLGPQELISACRDFKDYTTHTLCSVNEFLASSALTEWKKIVPKYKSWILENVSEFRNFVRDHREFLDWIEPQAGVVAFPFLKDQLVCSKQFAASLVEQTGVSLLPGDAFEVPGHFRIGFGIAPESFSVAMTRLSAFINSKKW
jgi:aspartate/methionine/tyrosine aminotransferase